MDYHLKKIQITFDMIKNKYPSIYDNLVNTLEERKEIIEYYEDKIEKLRQELKD